MNRKELYKRAFQDIHRACPGLFLSVASSALLEGIAPYVTVWFSSLILIELSGMRRPDVLEKRIIMAVAIIGILSLMRIVFKQWKEYHQNDYFPRRDRIFIEKMFSLDYEDMEKQSIHDLRLQIAQSEMYQGFGYLKLIEIFEKAIQNTLGILCALFLSVQLFSALVPSENTAWQFLNNPVFPIIMIILMVSLAVFSGKLTAKTTEEYMSLLTEEVSEANRAFGHFGFAGLDTKKSVDIRLYHQQDLIKHYWKNSLGVFGPSGMPKYYRGKGGMLLGLSVALNGIFSALLYLFTCLKAIAGAFGIGEIMRYVGAVTAMNTNVSGLIEVYGMIAANEIHLQRIYELLDTPNHMYQGSLTTEKRSDRQYDIEFKNVTFRYPNTDRNVLDHVNLRFKIGTRLAIVGENGSGKSTLIKLLCRLYDPQEGEILLNGINIRKYNYKDYIQLMSVVFQDYQLLSQPLANNIAGNSEYDEERVLHVLKEVGFEERLKSLQSGLETWLYKDFGEEGVILSGGEAQKVAIARALYKDAPFIILDEPTASLDPIAEAAIYSRLNEIVADRTAVFISHRLSSCRFCDEIIVLDKGHLVQQGTHEQLFKTDGKYRELWNAQAQYYRA